MRLHLSPISLSLSLSLSFSMAVSLHRFPLLRAHSVLSAISFHLLVLTAPGFCLCCLHRFLCTAGDSCYIHGTDFFSLCRQKARSQKALCLLSSPLGYMSKLGSYNCEQPFSFSFPDLSSAWLQRVLASMLTWLVARFF